MSGTTGSWTAGAAGVEDMAKDFWATRPRRPRRGRKIAGVAAGIANRYRIDPTLVRIGLVVAAIYGGAGIAVYLLGWLFLPEQDDEVSPFESMIGRGRSSTSTVFTLLLCLALIPTFSWIVQGFFPGYFGIAIVGGILYLLHRHRGNIGRADEPAPDPTATMTMPPTMPPTMPTMPTSTGPAAGVTMPLPNEPEAPKQEKQEPEPEQTTPPAWDPLGAAPFAWDLPDPSPAQDEQEPEPPEPRRKSRIGLVTVGIALIVAAGMAGISLEFGGIDAQHIVGVTLAVLGLGMVIGSFVRGGRGLIGLAVPLAVAGLGMTAVTQDGWYGLGDIDARPTRIGQVAPEYRKSAGSIQLDLTGLPNSGAVDTRIDLGVGDVTVFLPKDADVELTCRTRVGDVSCLGEVRSGVNNNDLGRMTDYGADGPGGLKIDLEIEAGTGSVEVSRRG